MAGRATARPPANSTDSSGLLTCGAFSQLTPLSDCPLSCLGTNFQLENFRVESGGGRVSNVSPRSAFRAMKGEGETGWGVVTRIISQPLKAQGFPEPSHCL